MPRRDVGSPRVLDRYRQSLSPSISDDSPSGGCLKSSAHPRWFYVSPKTQFPIGHPAFVSIVTDRRGNHMVGGRRAVVIPKSVAFRPCRQTPRRFFPESLRLSEAVRLSDNAASRTHVKTLAKKKKTFNLSIMYVA